MARNDTHRAVWLKKDITDKAEAIARRIRKKTGSLQPTYVEIITAILSIPSVWEEAKKQGAFDELRK